MNGQENERTDARPDEVIVNGIGVVWRLVR
jgi:hypothetical protein